MALIPKPQFPNVPNLPGVPQLTRSLQFPAAPPVLVGAALAIGRLWQALFSQTPWGIYRSIPVERGADGIETVTIQKRTPVIVPDTFLEFGFRNESDMSDYPVQGGGFMSYNKVANPFETTMRLAKGGSLQARTQFLQSIESIAGDLNFYDIVTPERTYLNVNVLRQEVARRGVKGAYFFGEVDIYFREIRIVNSTYTTTAVDTQNAKQASAVPKSNTGSVLGERVPDSAPEDFGIGDPP